MPRLITGWRLVWAWRRHIEMIHTKYVCTTVKKKYLYIKLILVYVWYFLRNEIAG